MVKRWYPDPPPCHNSKHAKASVCRSGPTSGVVVTSAEASEGRVGARAPAMSLAGLRGRLENGALAGNICTHIHITSPLGKPPLSSRQQRGMHTWNEGPPCSPKNAATAYEIRQGVNERENKKVIIPILNIISRLIKFLPWAKNSPVCTGCSIWSWKRFCWHQIRIFPLVMGQLQ